ncbi:MAG TPA: bifunctional DNA primase/polymerase, partial [Thermoleophilia bacterium]|nr:bifunctional DNA primase/polymerase [Thermoleophilia bacterium]
MNANGLLDAALAYAELGYAVFPCARGSKKPLTENGFKDATTDAAQIEAWWSKWPNANIGMATEGLVVIDEDRPDNPWLRNAPERQADLAGAPMSFTPRGGNHRIMRQPEGKPWRCSTSALASKVDVRADGGYIVLPPSVTRDGVYRWQETMELDCPPAELPEPPGWLVNLLDEVATRGDTGRTVASGAPVANTIPSGQRNATLARLGGTMRRV